MPDDITLPPGTVRTDHPGQVDVRLANPAVLVCEDPISTAHEILPSMEMASVASRPLVVVAPTVTGQALATLVLNTERRTLHSLVVSTSAIEGGDDSLDRIAAITGTRVYSRNALVSGGGPRSVDGLGRIASVRSTQDGVTFSHAEPGPDDGGSSAEAETVDTCAVCGAPEPVVLALCSLCFMLTDAYLSTVRETVTEAGQQPPPPPDRTGSTSSVAPSWGDLVDHSRRIFDARTAPQPADPVHQLVTSRAMEITASLNGLTTAAGSLQKGDTSLVQPIQQRLTNGIATIFGHPAAAGIVQQWAQTAFDGDDPSFGEVFDGVIRPLLPAWANLDDWIDSFFPDQAGTEPADGGSSRSQHRPQHHFDGRWHSSDPLPDMGHTPCRFCGFQPDRGTIGYGQLSSPCPALDECKYCGRPEQDMIHIVDDDTPTPGKKKGKGADDEWDWDDVEQAGKFLLDRLKQMFGDPVGSLRQMANDAIDSYFESLSRRSGDVNADVLSPWATDTGRAGSPGWVDAELKNAARSADPFEAEIARNTRAFEILRETGMPELDFSPFDSGPTPGDPLWLDLIAEQRPDHPVSRYLAETEGQSSASGDAERLVSNLFVEKLSEFIVEIELQG